VRFPSLLRFGLGRLKESLFGELGSVLISGKLSNCIGDEPCSVLMTRISLTKTGVCLAMVMAGLEAMGTDFLLDCRRDCELKEFVVGFLMTMY